MTNTQTTLTNGTRVYFISLTGLIDHDIDGTITDDAPVDPGTGRPNREFAWVRWADGAEELVTIDNLVSLEALRDA